MYASLIPQFLPQILLLMCSLKLKLIKMGHRFRLQVAPHRTDTAHHTHMWLIWNINCIYNCRHVDCTLNTYEG